MIGGWAVHAYGAKDLSFDGDAMVSLVAHGTLRDEYELTRNSRMQKEQFTAPTGHSIDLYVEHQHGLKVPFDELQAFCQQKDGLFVPCPEHLLILKLVAAKGRAGSAKGQKDVHGYDFAH